jgi:hypothetical protein
MPFALVNLQDFFIDFRPTVDFFNQAFDVFCFIPLLVKKPNMFHFLVHSIASSAHQEVALAV